MHIVYVMAPFGGPEACVQALQPWLESRGHRVSIVYNVAPDRRLSPFPPHVRVGYAVRGNLHAYLAKVVGGFQAWPLRVRAEEEARAIYQEIRRIDAEHPVDVVEVTEGIPIRKLRRRWTVVVRAHGSAWTIRLLCDRQPAPGDDRLIEAQRRQFQMAHAVSAISNHLADHVAEQCRFPRERIAAIPYPIGDDWLADADKQGHDAPGIPGIMAVGRLEKRKGTGELVQAMVQVWRDYPHLKLFLAGLDVGLSRDTLLEMVPEHLRQQLVFLGFVPRDQLRERYRSITAYVAPTRYETFGYTILEAMACGAPVVSTRTGAIPELIDDGVNGFLNELDDVDGIAARIRLLVAQPEIARRIAAGAKQKARSYSLSSIGPALEELYVQARKARMARAVCRSWTTSGDYT